MVSYSFGIRGEEVEVISVTETKRKEDMAPTPLLGNCRQDSAAAGVIPIRGAKREGHSGSSRKI